MLEFSLSQVQVKNQQPRALGSHKEYGSVAEHQSCKLKVQGSIPCAGSLL